MLSNMGQLLSELVICKKGFSRGRELGKHYADFGIGSSCYLSKGYALVSVSMARKSASRGSARLVTSRVDFYDSAETTSILLSLQRAQLEIALFSYISD